MIFSNLFLFVKKIIHPKKNQKKKVLHLHHLINHDVEGVTGPSCAVLAIYILLVFF